MFPTCQSLRHEISRRGTVLTEAEWVTSNGASQSTIWRQCSLRIPLTIKFYGSTVPSICKIGWEKEIKCSKNQMRAQKATLITRSLKQPYNLFCLPRTQSSVSAIWSKFTRQMGIWMANGVGETRSFHNSSAMPLTASHLHLNTKTYGQSWTHSKKRVKLPVSRDRVSWGQKTAWDRKQKSQDSWGKSHGMAPTGLSKPYLCQCDWTQLKRKKEHANKNQTKR